jgi:hypothetical protein
MIGDPFTALSTLIIGIYDTHKIQQWISLIFQTAFSSVVVFCFSCGSSLIASKSWPVSVGIGMVGVAGTMVTFFLKSKLTKGMLLVAPTEVMKVEKDNSLTEIQR